MSGLKLFDPMTDRPEPVVGGECVLSGTPAELGAPTDLSSMRAQAFTSLLTRWLEREGVKVKQAPQGGDCKALRLAVQDVELQGPGLGDRLLPAVGLQGLLHNYHPEALRYYLLSEGYRAGLGLVAQVRCPTCSSVMSEAAQDDLLCEVCDTDADDASVRKALQLPGLDAADAQVAYVYDTLLGAARVLSASKPAETGAAVMPAVGAMQDSFRSFMNDDLNTQGAFKALAEPLKEANRLTQSGKGVDPPVRTKTLSVFVEALRELGDVLGLFGMAPLKFVEERRALRAHHLSLDPQHIEALVQSREAARAAKDWTKADEARAELDALGVRVTDSPEGSIWSL